MGGKFKLQVQDSDLEYLFWQCEKHIALSEEKPPLHRVKSKVKISSISMAFLESMNFKSNFEIESPVLPLFRRDCKFSRLILVTLNHIQLTKKQF